MYATIAQMCDFKCQTVISTLPTHYRMW